RNARPSVRRALQVVDEAQHQPAECLSLLRAPSGKGVGEMALAEGMQTPCTPESVVGRLDQDDAAVDRARTARHHASFFECARLAAYGSRVHTCKTRELSEGSGAAVME